MSFTLRPDLKEITLGKIAITNKPNNMVMCNDNKSVTTSQTAVISLWHHYFLIFAATLTPGSFRIGA